jgi:rfaE bifunctional protein kinase chain/domain
MCHGTFDIVHPGHIRHLMYAKEKADILVASLTCDAHISKANFRPYVPEQLRALNLAALEVVDYVIIDRNPTPIENLKLLKPDFFAKGYEYNADGVNPKTQEEVAALESYGGEIIFTPGDIVYSSSHIIERREPPRLAAEKLKVLMESEGLTFDDLRKAVQAFKGKKITIVGDTIVDSYIYTTMIGGGTKTPTFSVKWEEQKDFSGGAAIVAKHMAITGAKVKFITVMGNDPLKDFVIGDLSQAGVECRPIIDKTRPTTQKAAYICTAYRMLKVDKVDNRAVNEKIVQKITGYLSEAKGDDAVVFSDFRHGIFSKNTIPKLIESLPKGPLRIADSQVASRWGNILDFVGFDLITPNEKEARFALGDQDLVIRPLALEIYKRAKCKYLILKLGERGLIAYRPGDSEDPRNFFTVDAFAEHAVDPVGTGDALLAYATLSLAATKSESIAAILGSVAAAIACEQEGNIPVRPDKVLKRIEQIEKRIEYRR